MFFFSFSIFLKHLHDIFLLFQLIFEQILFFFFFWRWSFPTSKSLIAEISKAVSTLPKTVHCEVERCTQTKRAQQSPFWTDWLLSRYSETTYKSVHCILVLAEELDVHWWESTNLIKLYSKFFLSLNLRCKLVRTLVVPYFEPVYFMRNVWVGCLGMPIDHSPNYCLGTSNGAWPVAKGRAIASFPYFPYGLVENGQWEDGQEGVERQAWQSEWLVECFYLRQRGSRISGRKSFLEWVGGMSLSFAQECLRRWSPSLLVRQKNQLCLAVFSLGYLLSILMLFSSCAMTVLQVLLLYSHPLALQVHFSCHTPV